MQGNLFPVVEVPDFIPESTGYDAQYRRSARWNPVAGDFVRDGAHGAEDNHGGTHGKPQDGGGAGFRLFLGWRQYALHLYRKGGALG